MSNELASSILDQMLLMCVLQTRSPLIRALILSNTVAEDYGTPYGQEIRKRIDVLLGLGKSLGLAIDFSQDAALSSGAANFIRGTPGRRKEAGEFDKERVDNLIYRLKLIRNKRTVSKAIVDINALSSGKVDEELIEKMAGVMEKTLIGIRKGFDQQPLTHMGRRQTAEGARLILNDTLAYDPAAFISTGLARLDFHMYGYERGNLVTFSAPSGGGKSTLAMVTGINQYLKSKHNVVYVSMEMTKKELWRRVMSNVSGVPHELVRVTKNMTPEQRRRVGREWRAFHEFGQANGCTFTVWDIEDSKFTPMKLEASLAPLMYDSIIVDYITLFDPGKMERWEMQLEYSRYLKAMAKRLNCVVILLTQLSDEEKIKYGRGILENTDYWLHWRIKDEDRESGTVELRLEKARHTKARAVNAQFMFEIMRVDTLDVDPVGEGVNAVVDERKERTLTVNSSVFQNADGY